MKYFLSMLILGWSSLAAAKPGPNPPHWKGCPTYAHASFSPESKKLVLTGQSGKLACFDLTSGHSQQVKVGGFNLGGCSYGGHQVAVAAARKKPFEEVERLALWTPGQPGAREIRLSGGTPWICRWAGPQLVIGGPTGARLLNPETAQILRTYPHQSGEVQNLALHPDGRQLAQVETLALRVFDVASDRPKSQLQARRLTRPRYPKRPNDPNNFIFFDQVSWLGPRVAVSSYTGAGQVHPVQIFDPQKGLVTETVNTGHRQAVTGLAGSKDGKLLVTVAWDGELRWWSMPGHKLLGQSRCYLGERAGGFTPSLAFSPNGKWLVVTSEYACASLFQVSNRQLVAILD